MPRLNFFWLVIAHKYIEIVCQGTSNNCTNNPMLKHITQLIFSESSFLYLKTVVVRYSRIMNKEANYTDTINIEKISIEKPEATLDSIRFIKDASIF